MPSTTFRNVVFTINSPQIIHFNFNPDVVKYCIWQLEKAPSTSTPHLQGYIEADLKGRIARLRGDYKLKQAMIYISERISSPKCAEIIKFKAASRLSGPWEFGTWSGRGEGPVVDIMLNMIREGADDRDIAEAYPTAWANKRPVEKKF